MKLEFPNINVIKSGDFSSQNFDFGDKRVIMNILRKKMYSNPIRAICQEVMSNSRDANREVGKGDIPITIHIPNRFDENIKFIDEGPGISPDRMENVFIKYGNSTKRSDNVQTGGFGLGAKTPFAYTDTFTIVTTTKDKDGRHKRTYIAYIDESQLGAMSLVSTEKTDENTGTSIIIGVEKDDIGSFTESIKQVGRFWNPKPEIIGTKLWSWPSEVKTIGNDTWYIADRGAPVIIIDDIPYKLQINHIYPNGIQDETSKVLSTSIRLFFSVGELDITANREDLDYQPATIDKIKEAGRKVVEELRTHVNKSVQDSKTLWDAICAWEDVSRQFHRFVVKPKWNNIELNFTSISVPYTLIPKTTTRYSDVITIRVYDFDHNKQNAVSAKRYRSIIRDITVCRTTLLVEDDCGEQNPHKRRLITAFKDNSDINRIGVVTFKNPAAKVEFEKLLNWNSLGAKLLSSFPKAPNPSLAKRAGRTVHKVKKLQKKNGRAHSDFYEWVPENTRVAEDNLGGFYVIIHSGKIKLKGDTEISRNQLAKLQNILKQPIYGMLYKWRKKISADWTELSENLEEKIEKMESSQGFQDYMRFGFEGNALDFFGKPLYNKLKKVKLQKSILKDWIRITEIVLKEHENFLKANQLRELLNLQTCSPCNDAMKSLKKRVFKTLPFVKFLPLHRNLSGYHRNHYETTIKKAVMMTIDYVNLKSKEK